MNESDLEDELRGMQPARVSGSLRAGIEAELMPRSEIPVRAVATVRRGNLVEGILQLFFRTSLTLGAAALVACGILALRLAPNDSNLQPSGGNLAERGKVGHPSAGSFLPIESSRKLIDAGEEEVLYSEASDPAVRVRLRSIERHAWADMERGAFIAIEVPREDVVLIPVSMQ